jgi:hypothetical protein
VIEVIHQLIVATVLAIVPYLLIRGPVTRIVGRFPRHDNVTCYQEKQDVNENQQIADKANAQATRSTSEQAADPRVDLAVQRTELALDRTQLAWVRTAFTLITAGFAIDKDLVARGLTRRPVAIHAGLELIEK